MKRSQDLEEFTVHAGIHGLFVNGQHQLARMDCRWC